MAAYLLVRGFFVISVLVSDVSNIKIPIVVGDHLSLSQSNLKNTSAVSHAAACAATALTEVLERTDQIRSMGF